MGEYATYNGESIKIGTCEDMYYLRYDQRHLVRQKSGNVNPMDAEDLKTIRFRFPWPDEDGTPPGHFDGDYMRTLSVSGLKIPAGVKHYSVQFRADPGYLMSIPCPEGPGEHPAKIHKNGWRGDVLLAQQALRGGRLVSIFHCGGCDAAFRIEDFGELAGLLSWLRTPERCGMNGDVNDARIKYFAEIADRIEAGYRQEVSV